jgi:S-adenosylmethionine hydrolase
VQITLTTDFGTRDGYVGAMKGVLAREAPAAAVVDVAHDVPRHDTAHAAWVVATACREFPSGTVHVVVVDPGVGGARRGVVVASGGSWYVGPDNGVFAYLDGVEAWQIPVAGHAVSPTFHGRDVFAPAAARLARGEPVAGDRVALVGTLPWGPRRAGDGRVVHVDRYGNLISDLPAAEAGDRVTVAGRTLAVQTTYENVGVGVVVAYVGSAGTIEVAVREGRADTTLRLARGADVRPG